MTVRWTPGEVIVRREVLGLQPREVTTPQPAAGVWTALPVVVVEDSPDQLVTYIAPGAPMSFPPGPWPTPDGLHPWHGRDAWEGHGCLMVQRPEDHFAIWHFWDGPDRTFQCWYLNIQTAAVRTAIGFDTQDHELDIVVLPDGRHIVKDDEVMDDRVREGRFSPELVAWVRAYGATLVERYLADGRWWDDSWAHWEPDPAWIGPRLPADWQRD